MDECVRMLKQYLKFRHLSDVYVAKNPKEILQHLEYKRFILVVYELDVFPELANLDVYIISLDSGTIETDIEQMIKYLSEVEDIAKEQL